jgi:hypothetical protein
VEWRALRGLRELSAKLRIILQEDPAMTDFQTPPAREPGPQPDPMLQSGRRSSGWVWLFGLAIVAIVTVTLYGMNNREPQTAANEPAATQGQAQTTGTAPKEEQTDQQNKSEAKPQNADANKQGAPANAQNNAAPNKDQSGQTNKKPQQ